MLDIIGIGALNLDLTVTNEKINSLPPDEVREVERILEFGAERPMDLKEINNIITLLGPDSFRAVLGGSAFNTIHAIAALNSDIKAGYVGVAGPTNNSGLSFAELMQELSIDEKYVSISSDQSSGLCICINREGVRSFLLYPGCNNKMADFLQKNYHDILLYLTKARILHLTSFIDEKTPVILARIIRAAKRKNPVIQISCDPGYSWLKNLTPAVISILKITDFLFLNRIEYNLLGDGRPSTSDSEKSKRIFAQYGLQETQLILKDESEIKIYGCSNQQIVEQRYAIKVISNEQISDSTGAGDLFAAGFLTVQLLKGKAMPDAVELGIRFMRTKLITPPEKLYPELASIFVRYSYQAPDL